MNPADLHSRSRTALARRRLSPAEARVEALLAAARQQEKWAESSAPAPAPAAVSPLVRLRELFANELSTAFNDLKERYGPQGVTLEMDAGPLLQGGTDIRIRMEFRGAGLRLDGTVTPNLIAFQQTRYSRTDIAGLTGSGPTLRVRDLTAPVFRDFVCERLGALLQTVVGRRG